MDSKIIKFRKLNFNLIEFRKNNFHKTSFKDNLCSSESEKMIFAKATRLLTA